MEEKARDKCFCCGVGPQVTAVAQSILPGAAQEHFRASKVEFLKGLRHLLDSRIQKMSVPKTHGASIPVD